MLKFSDADFVYEPYPTAEIASVFDADVYAKMLASYPPLEKFQYRPDLGEKYAFSHHSDPAGFRAYLDAHPHWRGFHDYIKSDGFIEEILGFLEAHNIDLNLGRRRTVSRQAPRKKTSMVGRLRGETELNARFEFSMMNGEGGHILPHTDQKDKLITLVLPMVAPGEWNPAWGGGTDVVWPKDKTLSFNIKNRYLEFDAVDRLRTLEFKPNNCVLFIKTYNSWHSVSPMTSGDRSILRRTLTVNIERRA